MGATLYNILIKPIELIIETIFAVAYRYSLNPGIAIVCVSLVVNFLVLPLYKRSDAMQEEERKKQESMKHWVDHIKATFKGDERYMMLQTYYRQVGYSPIQAVRGSFSLLLQIPFFIAAYHFLSNLELLKGTSFLGIADLGMPDGMLTIAGISINVLPILMTLINFVSGAIYTKGFPLKDKLQLYIVALAFLVLLYTSPAGLVMYWTLNNVFSLLKNIVMKLFVKKENKEKSSEQEQAGDAAKKTENGVFVLGIIFLTLLMGLMIPSSVVSSAPTDFVGATIGPIQLVFRTLCVYVGFFLVWFSIFYYLGDAKARKIFSYLLWMASGVALIDYFIFYRDMGVISAYLVYDNGLDYTASLKYINLAVVVVTAGVLYVIIRYFKKAVKFIYGILIASAVFLGGFNLYTTAQTIAESNYYILHGATDYEKILPVSTMGKNVIVIMLDRAVNGYIPYIMEENPTIKEQFDGFTYYPNTMGYGGVTHFAGSALYGGYEYTPDEINERPDERLAEKHNESLKMLPVLFSERGYKVNVCDPPLVNYSNKWDLSIFDEYEGIDAHFAESPYVEDVAKEFGPYFEATQLHNFVGYSLVKVAPLKLQKFLYDAGKYLKADKDTVISSSFMSSYSGLRALPRITDVEDSEENTFLIMTNNTAHEPTVLQVPEYEAVLFPDNSEDDGVRRAEGYPDIELSDVSQKGHYDVNVLALKKLGEWFDFLRENGAYDNTRIIVVSDHAIDLNQFSELHFDNGFSFEGFHPLLLVKDFGASGFNTSNEFMTNADVATLATESIIENPVNPFTGKPINNDEKTAHPQTLMTSMDWDYLSDSGTTFTNEDGEWWSVEENVFDGNNWKKRE